MKVTFEIEYRTRWGEMLYLCSGGTSRAMRCANDRWTLIVDLPAGEAMEYHYAVRSEQGIRRREWGGHRLPACRAERLRVFDFWSDRPRESAYYSSAFTEGFMNRKHAAGTETGTTADKTGFANPAKAADKTETKSTAGTGFADTANAANAADTTNAAANGPLRAGSLFLTVEAPTVGAGERLALTGAGERLGEWNTERAMLLDDSDFPRWSLTLENGLPQQGTPYKFVIVDAATLRPLRWEPGENRRWSLPEPDGREAVIASGLRFDDPETRWRGAGVAIPVFSLRSEESFGIGEFADLKLMVDWAVATGQKIIQVLPVNDTTMSGTWLDSYPYNANSTFALHPQFLRLEAAGELSDRAVMEEFRQLGRELNALPEVDYEHVNRAKNDYMRRLFDEQGAATLASEEFRRFFRNNEAWIVPYAAYCVLRDRYRTADFSRWGDFATFDPMAVARLVSRGEGRREAERVYFVQYHLDRQLREVRNYAHAHGVVLKGDIPIGISRTSVDAWATPELFHMDGQAGAPPDDFSVLGQNWGFPTYNWKRMAEDGYAWWQARFRKMAEYFDAYRIDHILGFFRIWEIPADAVHGLLGHFSPALPYSVEELRAAGIPFDAERYARPYIRREGLKEIFGERAGEVCSKYLSVNGDGSYSMRPEVATQRAVQERFAGCGSEEEAALREGLMELLDEVLFVEDPVRRGCYHPRIAGRSTRSYRALPPAGREAFDRLHDDFFYRRHNDFWRDEACRKLPPIVSATRMLVCGEDLGMIPACVPEVMASEQILSLEIQRMPKEFGVEFGDPSGYPYRSVATTSTHDMTLLRAWWEEDPKKSERFYRHVLGQCGRAPAVCTPRIAELIVRMHLASPAMLTILPLQDWLAIDGRLRRKNPHEERINVPSIARYHWRYRMHLTLEKLLRAGTFNARVRTLIAESGRA